MHILVIGKFHTEAFGAHIAETCRELGHSVACFDPSASISGVHGKVSYRIGQAIRTFQNAAESIPVIRKWRAGRLREVAEATKPDLIIVTHDFLWPAEVEDLKAATRAPIVMWFPDAIVNFGRAYFMNAPYDAIFFKDPYLVATLREVLGSPTYFLPEGFNPSRHRLPKDAEAKLPVPEFACDICTAGNLYTYRVAFFSQLSDFDVKIWGNPAPMWMDVSGVEEMIQSRFVEDARKALAFRSAKIALNNLHPAEIWGANKRLFEIAGTGAFQMVDWRPGLGILFEDGKEIVSFSSMEDLRGKIAYFLREDAEREAIARAGMRRARRDHTYAIRIGQMLATLESPSRQLRVPDIQCEAIRRPS